MVHVFDTELVQVDFINLYPSIDTLSAHSYAFSAYMVNKLLYVSTNMNQIFVFSNKDLVSTYSNICETNPNLYNLAFTNDAFYVACYTDRSVVKYNLDGSLGDRLITTVKPPICITIDQFNTVYLSTLFPFPGLEVIS